MINIWRSVPSMILDERVCARTRIVLESSKIYESPIRNIFALLTSGNRHAFACSD